MPARDTWCLVLARDPAGAKSRLAAVLDERSRAELAVAMLADVLAAAGAVGFACSVVVTESDAIRAVARQAGAETLAVPRSDTNDAAAAALRHAHAAGAPRALVLAADLPLLRADDLVALVDASDDADVVIGPDRHGRGTNALLVAPPLVINTAFGRDSLRLHREQAGRAGLRLRVITRPGIATDVDDEDDLRVVRADATLGSHTRDALGVRARD